MRYLFILLLPFWGWFAKSPEPKVIFKGIVKDKTSTEVIPYCLVSVRYSSGINFQTTTDEEGKYTFNLVHGDFTVEYSLIGYKKTKLSFGVKEKKDTTIVSDILLEDESITLDELVITSHRGLVKADVMKSSAPTKSVLKMPKRSVRGIATTSSGTSSGSSASLLGSRTDGTRLFIEGTPTIASYAEESPSGDRATYRSSGSTVGIKAGTLTAGEINDFSKWGLWTDLSKGELKSYVNRWGILPRHRFSVLVTNENTSPQADIEVRLIDPSGKLIWKSRTDNTGKAELWSDLFDSTDLKKGNFKVEAIYNGKTYAIQNATPFEKKINQMIIPSDCKKPLNMDIVFAVDATGSMGDEITYLQAELYDVIEKVKQRNPELNLNMGSVFYRDKQDAYLTVEQNLTSDINKVMRFMKAQVADGGGDEPEGVDAAMEVAIGKFNWSNDARARVMFLVLDASPHQDKETMERIKKYTVMAAEKGIRIVPIVCSGIDKAGEYLMRSLALATNGNYIFLTDHSGIGNLHIAPSTDKYEVETLNVLLIRLLQQYIFMPECNQTVKTSAIDSLQKNQTNDSAHLDSVFVKHPNQTKDSAIQPKPADWFLKYYPNPCRGILQIDLNAAITEIYIADINGKLLMKIPVSTEERHIEIDLTQYPAGIYFLRYCVDGVCKSGKFVLVH